MLHPQPSLNDWGWSDWFAQRAACPPGSAPARVVAVDRELLTAVDAAGLVRARLAGSFLHRHPQSEELPCVGDWVCLAGQPQGEFAIVRGVVERRTSLRRKGAGDPVQGQMIAANLDYAVIVQACHFDFNVNRLERYLVMALDGGAEPIVLLTKKDLVSQALLEDQTAQIRAAGITAPIAAISNATRDGVDELLQLLQPQKTYCFVGSSGVGKSTLINRLLGHARLDTQDVSDTGEGRHTTVRRELIRLSGGALVIDNPGMREFGLLGTGEGIAGSFADIAGLAEGCRFRDCSHTAEQGCAVRAALQEGALDQAHYQNFLKLRDEAEFHQLSYVEKRKKDRDFGKFLKLAKKDLR